MSEIESAPNIENRTQKNDSHPTSRSALLIAALLVIGLFFRFSNLDRKVYWNDEVWTSLWLSGHTSSEMIEQVCDGRVLSIEDLRRYQRVNDDRSLISTVSSLAADDPKQPPLYYVLLRLWAGLFGDSVKAIRGLSAVISLLVFPGLYWLCRQLFETTRTAWVAIALMAVSPFHVLYAQEARPYSLWTATILLSSAALLHTLRRRTRCSWSLYAATVALGLYSHLLFGLVMLAHAAYVAGISRSNNDLNARPKHVQMAYLLSTTAALVAFAPWALIILSNIRRLLVSTRWVALRDGVSRLFSRWLVGFGSIFFDVNRGLDDPLTRLNCILVLLVSLYAIYLVRQRSARRIWLLIVLLSGAPMLALMLPDLVLGGRLISTSRFLLPCYIGIQLAVAHVIATQTLSTSSKRRKVWQAVWAWLIVCGAVSCAISSQADAWWNKSFSSYNLGAARIINRIPRPLLISDSSGTNPRNVLSLCYLLDPKVRLMLVGNNSQYQVPDNFSDLFLFNPSAHTRQKLENEGYRIEAVDPTSGLWRLIK